MRDDINLVPKSEKDTSSVTILTYLVVIMVLALFGGIFGVYIPLQKKNSLNSKISLLESEIELNNDIDIRLSEISSEVDRVSYLNDALDNLKNKDTKTSQIIKDLEQILSTDIKVKIFSIEEGVLTLEGSTPMYKNVAQSMVKIRELDYVIDANLDEIRAYPKLEVREDSHHFILNIILERNEILYEEEVEEAQEEVQEEGEVEENEAN